MHLKITDKDGTTTTIPSAGQDWLALEAQGYTVELADALGTVSRDTATHDLRVIGVTVKASPSDWKDFMPVPIVSIETLGEGWKDFMPESE